MDESKTESEMSLDQSLKLGMRRAQIGESVRPHNCMIRAKPDDDVLSFVRKWAERHSFLQMAPTIVTKNLFSQSAISLRF